MPRNYSNFIQEYMNYSAFSEAPERFHFWTAVSAVAGALQRKVWIDMGYFEWTPNFYIVFVAPPGIVAKSSTSAIGMDLLKKVEGINFGPDSVTWQALAQSLAGCVVPTDIPGEEEPFRHSSITIVSSEFGTLFDPSDREMVDLMVSLWDGKRGDWTKATKTQGDDIIESPWINLIACTTPSWIEGFFPEYMIGGGFTSRTIFVYGDTKRHLVAYPSQHIPGNFEETQGKLVEDLTEISKITGAFTLTPEAFKYGEQWYSDHFEETHEHLESDRFGGYLARKQTHVHKLAIVLSAAESSDRIITAAHIANANEIITALEYDMPKVFHRIGTTDAGRILREFLSIVKTKGEVSRTALYKIMCRSVSIEEFKVVTSSAVQAGYVTTPVFNNQMTIKWVHQKDEEKTP